MCLDSRHTKKEMDEWLKTQPDMIIAYKLVEKIKIKGGKYKLIPIHRKIKTKKYKKKNRIRGNRPVIEPSDSPRRTYKAYFHLWLEIPGVYWHHPYAVIIKCHVPKHLITAVGRNNCTPTIVSKGFDIVKEC